MTRLQTTSGKVRDLGWQVGSMHLSPYTVRTGNTPKVRFFATLDEEPEVLVALI